MNQYATAIDENNIGKIVSFHKEGWKLGTLVDMALATVVVKPIVGKHAREIIVPRNDVKLTTASGETPAPVETPKGDVQVSVSVSAPVIADLRAVRKTAKAVAQQMKKAQPKKSGKPEELAEPPAKFSAPEHMVELKALEGSTAYTATIGNRKMVVLFQERNRATAARRWASVTLSRGRMKDCPAMAKKLELPLLVALQVRVNGKWDSGWLVRFDEFKRWKVGTCDFNLSPESRTSYTSTDAKNGGFKFEVAK